jgi:Nuclease-related domain
MSNLQRVLIVGLIFAPTFLFLAIVSGWIWWRLRRKSRRPVKDKLLRAAGESLRQRMEQFDEKLFNNLIWILLYGPIWSALFFLYLIVRLKSPYLHFEIACFAVVVVIVTVFLSRKAISALQRYRNDILGFKGERAVGEELNKLMLDGCLVYHDVPGEGAWNVDHVVVAPTGVYAVETKTRSKDRCNKDRKDYEVIYDGKTLQYPNWTDTHGLDQARANARWLAKHLSNALAEEIKVTPILTLPGWLVTNRVKPSGNELRVLNHKQIRSVIVDGRAPAIDDKRLKQIGYQLELKCRDVEF